MSVCMCVLEFVIVFLFVNALRYMGLMASASRRLASREETVESSMPQTLCM